MLVIASRWGFDASGRGEVVITARWHYDKQFTPSLTVVPATFMGGKAKVVVGFRACHRKA